MTTSAQMIAWLQTPDAIRVCLVEVVARISTTETTLYLSNRPYTTSSGATPASTAYDPCVVGGVTFSETLSLDGAASISYGDIEVDNTAGTRDAWLGYVWANRQIKVYMGDARWTRADFYLVFDGVVGDLGSRAPGVLNLSLLDKLQRLNNPISETVLGGSTANKNELVPLTFGECHNVTPLLVDPATLKYQFHGGTATEFASTVGGGAAEDVIEVRDNGVPVTVTELLTSGRFTLAQAPAGEITASVQGAKPSGTYSNNVSTLIQYIVQNFGPSATRLSGGDLDSSNLSTFASTYTQPVGLYAAGRVNVLEACQQLAAAVGAQVVMSTQGLLRLIRLAIPGSATISVTAADMDQRSLMISERPPVKSACVLGYCKNWTVQDGLNAGLAGSVPPSSAALFASEWLPMPKTDSAVAAIYKTPAQPPQENSLILVTADAETESQRRLDLWKAPRSVYTARYRAHLLLTELGDAMTITHSRFGLSGGKTGIVVRVERDWLGGRVTLGVLA